VVWLERGESTSTIQECPPRFTTKPEGVQMTVMIGIDPHKATHTAVAVDNNEVVLGEFKVSASKAQVGCCASGQTGSRNGNGLSNRLTGSAICSHASLFKQERPQRCSVGCDSCDAIGSAGPGRCR
jgi:hypothetical protein